MLTGGRGSCRGTVQIFEQIVFRGLSPQPVKPNIGHALVRSQAIESTGKLAMRLDRPADHRFLGIR